MCILSYYMHLISYLKSFLKVSLWHFVTFILVDTPYIYSCGYLVSLNPGQVATLTPQAFYYHCSVPRIISPREEYISLGSFCLQTQVKMIETLQFPLFTTSF